MCGLCGNFDQRSNNDFTTRDHMVVQSELDFGNSWKEAPTCPDVTTTPEPCTKNPHRRAWAEKQCSIIKSSVFAICHSKVGGAGRGQRGKGVAVVCHSEVGGAWAGPAQDGCGRGLGRQCVRPEGRPAGSSPGT